MRWAGERSVTDVHACTVRVILGRCGPSGVCELAQVPEFSYLYLEIDLCQYLFLLIVFLVLRVPVLVIFYLQ